MRNGAAPIHSVGVVSPQAAKEVPCLDPDRAHASRPICSGRLSRSPNLQRPAGQSGASRGPGPPPAIGPPPAAAPLMQVLDEVLIHFACEISCLSPKLGPPQPPPDWNHRIRLETRRHDPKGPRCRTDGRAHGRLFSPPQSFSRADAARERERETSQAADRSARDIRRIGTSQGRALAYHLLPTAIRPRQPAGNRCRPEKNHLAPELQRKHRASKPHVAQPWPTPPRAPRSRALPVRGRSSRRRCAAART